MKYTQEHLDKAASAITLVKSIISKIPSSCHNNLVTLRIDIDTTLELDGAISDCIASIANAARRIQIAPDLVDDARTQATRAQIVRDESLVLIKQFATRLMLPDLFNEFAIALRASARQMKSQGDDDLKAHVIADFQDLADEVERVGRLHNYVE